MSKLTKQVTQVTQIGNYKAIKTGQGHLIQSVELTVIEPTKRGNLDILIGQAEMFVATFKLRVLKNKVGSFVRLNHGGPGIGRITDLFISEDQKFLMGDLLITNPEAFEMVKRGELTERSITFDANMLFDIALLSGQQGQDSEEFPDLTVSIEKEFGKIEGELLLKKAPVAKISQQYKESEMELTPENIKALAEALKPLIKEAVKAEVEISSPEVDMEDQIREQAAKLVAGDTANNAEIKRRLTVKGYVDALVKGGNHRNSVTLKKMFDSLDDNYVAMEIQYKRLNEKTEADVKLEVEEEWSTPSFEDELKAEYKAYAKRTPSTTVTEEDYISLAKGEMKADFGDKIINKVK